MTQNDTGSAELPPLRTLVLLRHGKSDYPGGTRDYDRPLADRGESEAAAAGRWLRITQPPIDAVICSSSLRTRQTFAATGIGGQVRYADSIYEASPGEVLTEIRATDPAAHAVLVVGHAPGLPGLAHRLAGPDSDDAAMDELTSKFPTSAMAVFSYRGEWADLGPSDATLVAFEVARVPHSDHT